MKIDNQLISRLETLARLELSEAERAQIQPDLNKILNMVDKLNELEIDDVEPLVYLNQEGDRERKDEVGNQLTTEDALKNARDNDGTYFRVPKFVKNS